MILKNHQITKHQNKIAIDIMGSEISPYDIIKAVGLFSQKNNYNFLLIGILEYEKYAKEFNIPYLVSDDFINLEDDPLYAIRKKKKSSLCLGINLIKEKKASIFISCANTGALVTYAKLKLKLIKNISRPALIALMPTKKNLLTVCDVGANINCNEKNLLDFAKMGRIFSNLRGVETPKIGLLNIGTEEKKGSKILRATYKKLKETAGSDNSFEFIGNIEGKDVFDGNIDVLVTDGFSGNVFLKTSLSISHTP